MGFWHLIFGYYGGGEPTPIRIYTRIDTLVGASQAIAVLCGASQEVGVLRGSTSEVGTLKGNDRQ